MLMAAAAAILAIAATGVYWFASREPTPQLIAQLESGDVAERIEAARQLGKLRAAKAVSELVPILEEDEYELRQAARESLANIGPPAVPALVASLDEDRLLASMEANDALAEIGTDAVPELIRLLESEDDPVQLAMASYGLRQVGREGVTALEEALGSDKEVVRLISLDTLRQMGEDAKPALPAVLKALHHDDPAMRCGAASVLGAIGPEDERVVPALTEALKDEDPGVRLTAVDALAGIGPSARSAIVALQLTRERSNDEFREIIDWALSQISGENE